MTDTVHSLRVNWSVSRGRDTEGYNIVTLTDEDTGRRQRTLGGGYDMVGTVFGDWLASAYPNRLAALTDGQLSGLYGFKRKADGRVQANGACGLESMISGAEAIGLTVRKTLNRRGSVTGFIVTGPSDSDSGATDGAEVTS